jgi:hypothetical protein
MFSRFGLVQLRIFLMCLGVEEYGVAWLGSCLVHRQQARSRVAASLVAARA